MRVLRTTITGILLATLLLALVRVCPAQAQRAASESSVDRLIRGYFQAVERESLAFIEQNFYFTNAEARQKVLAQFQFAFDMADTRIESLDVTDVTLHQERQIGLVFAKVRGTLTQPRLGESQTKEHSYVILVRPDGGRWKIAKVMRRADYDNAIRIAASSDSGGTGMIDVVDNSDDNDDHTTPGGNDTNDPGNSSNTNGDTPSVPGEPSNAYQAYVHAYNALTKLMATGKGNTPEAQQAYAEYKKAKELYEQELKSNNSNMADRPNDPAHPSGNDQPKTITLSPVADAGVYAYAYRNWNKSNQGAYSSLRTGWHPSGGMSRAYLRFELPGTAGSFNKATLRLFHNHTGGSNFLPLAVHAVTAAWVEGRNTYHSGQTERPATNGEITWVNQPTMDESPVATFKPGPKPNTYIDVDITPLAKAWLTGKQNHGLTITPIGTLNSNTPESSYGFCSREHDDKSKRPVLILSAHSNSAQSSLGDQSQHQGSVGQPHVDTPTDEGYILNEQPEEHNKPILLFAEDFSQGPGSWNVNGQPPTIRDGRAYFRGGNNQTLGNNVMVPIEDFAVEFDAYSDGQMLSVLVATKQLKLYAASMQRGATVLLAHSPQHAKQAPAAFEPGAWHHYRFVRFGDQIELYLDGKRVARHTFAGTLDGPGLLGFSAMDSTIGLDNIRFYDLSRMPRLGGALPPSFPAAPDPSRPAPVVDNPPRASETEPNQPRRFFGRFRRR